MFSGLNFTFSADVITSTDSLDLTPDFYFFTSHCKNYKLWKQDGNVIIILAVCFDHCVDDRYTTPRSSPNMIFILIFKAIVDHLGNMYSGCQRQ